MNSVNTIIALIKYSLTLCLIFVFSTITIKQTLAKQFEAQHRANLIDINGELVTQEHPRYNELAQDGGISVHVDDSLALVAFYHSMNGNSWRNNEGWLVELVEFWHGIEEVEEIEPDVWRVTRIEIEPGNMTEPGVLPPEIGMMEYLERIKCADNLVTGTIIPEYASLKNLFQFRFRNNFLIGEIPWEVMAPARNFKTLRARNNFLTGELPSLIGENADDGELNFPSLQEIELNGNQISGTIPESINNLHENFNTFYLSENQLSGDFPEWPDLEMEDFRVDNNDFTPGPLPESILNWATTLEHLKIHNTNRTGVIPEWFAELTSLYRLHGIGEIEGGQDAIGGEIPESMKFLVNLDLIALYGRNFTGNAPPWFSDMPSLSRIEFYNVGLTGTLPEEWASAPRWNWLILENSLFEGGIPENWQTVNMSRFLLDGTPNMEIGQIPDWVGNNWTNLGQLKLRNTGIIGQIPESLSNFSGSHLNLENNPELTGDLPEWFANEGFEITRLRLSHTGLNISDIPGYLENWEMIELTLGGYGIEGEIPEWMGGGNWHELEVLALDGNDFSGLIPQSLGNLIWLDSLNLANNSLSGEIPASLVDIGRVEPDLTMLGSLVLSGNNDLTGQIPMKFTDAKFLRVLEFEDTDLCIPNDPSFVEWMEGIETYAESFYPAKYYSVKSNGTICGEGTSAEIIDMMPDRVNLYQNYPNPFNPTTTIKFDLSYDTHVTLQVYNALGQKVATLVNNQLSTGTHQVNFDATKFASGTYFYRLQVGDRVLNQKMMLIK